MGKPHSSGISRPLPDSTPNAATTPDDAFTAYETRPTRVRNPIPGGLVMCSTYACTDFAASGTPLALGILFMRGRQGLVQELRMVSDVCVNTREKGTGAPFACAPNVSKKFARR